MYLNMYEIFEKVNAVKEHDQKVAEFRKHDSPTLRACLRGIYHPNVEYCISRIPEYKPDTVSPLGMSYSNMGYEIKKAYIFETNNPNRPRMSEEKQMSILALILESLEAKEAAVYSNMLLKKPYPGINYDLVKEAFPSLLP